MLTVTRAAFGEGPPGDSQVAGWDGRAVAALAGDELLGSAGWTRVINEMSEIVGVAVAEHARRRGIGAALTVAATREAFTEGASLALLTPGSDATARVYARAGFHDATTMLHLRYER
jgi:GNAT superfamily N-acetyltransferase